MDLPEFVPAEYCLACRGCCVFDTGAPGSAGGDWAPRLLAEDVGRLKMVDPSGSWRDDPIRLRLLSGADDPAKKVCCLLDRSGHLCRRYSDRPLECRLYPFLLSSEIDGIKLYAHEACPYVRGNRDTPAWRSHLARLKARFSAPDLRQALARGRDILADYSRTINELIPIADIRRTFPAQWPLLQQALERYVAAAPQDEAMLSSRCFASLAMWHDHFDLVAIEDSGWFWIEARQPAGSFVILPPLNMEGAPGRGVCLSSVFRRLKDINGASGVGRVEGVSSVDLSDLPAGQYIVEPRGKEYVYRRRDIAQLSGGVYKSQRHDVNLAQRESCPVWRPYSAADREGCLLLLERWLDNRGSRMEDDISRFTLQDTRLAHPVLWDHAAALALVGRVAVGSEGRIIGYTFGARLNANVFCVLAEVADPSCRGLAAWLFSALASDEALRPYDFMNTMDDGGSPSLAANKMLWNPVRVLEVRALRPKE